MLHPRGKWGKKVHLAIEQWIKSQQKLSTSKSAFNLWKESFRIIYPEHELNQALYANHCLLILISATFLHGVLDKEYGELHESIETPRYFRWMENFPPIIAYQQELADLISQHGVSKTDLFGEISGSLEGSTIPSASKAGSNASSLEPNSYGAVG